MKGMIFRDWEDTKLPMKKRKKGDGKLRLIKRVVEPVF